MSELKFCALQIGTLALSNSRLDYYLQTAAKSGAKVVLLGEYVINSFFAELELMPKSMIKEQSESKKKALAELAIKYDLHIIAPIVLVKPKEYVKAIAHFSQAGVKYRVANALMPYSHWNEAAFFSANESLEIGAFSVDGFKFATIFGFEAHFDEFFVLARAKKIDCLLMPTACALESGPRWDSLLSMRAFTNNIYILRANRLGKATFGGGKNEHETQFYGRSMLCSPHGEITHILGEKEEMLLATISKSELNDAKKTWKFGTISNSFVR
ncbi:MAG: carbon-nitrogen hydrolase family protein [Campylobacter sp.]|uniref:carbon-nitrogen hydrolase family protein n=1 Tax=Campylobacter sp. TaxID=205 RepID=UPI002A82DA42|nr:carbon-nitrogen hydrolase family protein [Campylobacter sp.]MCI7587254.1 carbon-nitrogen hydrolase family protein [Campylobacter sp.]MDY5114374.1 carbon-nitrogen hydrolase family protein [Campylobacter sp.]